MSAGVSIRESLCWLIAGGLLLASLVLIPTSLNRRPRVAPEPIRVEEARKVVQVAPMVASTPDGKPVGPAPTAPGGWEEILQRINATGSRIEDLVSGISPSGKSPEDLERLEEIRRLLAELATALRALPNDAATAAMLAYLDSGEDVGTRLPFQVGEGGLLAESPTMRTFLLDLFADIDATSALDYSVGLFDSSNSANEWALAMRNIAWQDSDGQYREILRGRLGQMLDRQEWLVQPAEGFLEGFDLAVYLADEEALLEMGSVLGLSDSAGNLADNGVTHAAFLAMDRITANDPGQTVALVRSDRDFLSWAPRHRGALMSRADIRDPGQAEAVGEYLRRSDLSPEERHAFLNLFPNPNGVLGDSLVSNPATPLEFTSGLERDQAALRLVQGWLADSRYQFAWGDLAVSEARLRGFVAAGGQ